MIRTTAIAFMLLLSGLAAAAQDVLTLERAIELGLQRSARIAELEARRAGAEATEDARGAARMPSVAAQAGYTRTNHVEEFLVFAPGQPRTVLYPDVPDNYRARLDLQWPIYTGGRLEALQRAARAEANASAEDVEAGRADLRLEITRAYWALATARETERVVGSSIANLDAHIRDLRARLDQGLIPPNELLTAQARRAREQVLGIEAANNTAVAEADLRRLIGDEPAGPLRVMALEPSRAGQSATTASDRAERRALLQRLDASKMREEAARAQSKPAIGVGGGYDYARPNPRIFPRTDEWHDSWDASVSLTWTLWDGGRRAADRAEAVAATRAIAARVEEFDRQLAFDIHARQLDVETARASIDAASEGIAAAVEARRVVAERYAAGVATSTDVLDAELAVLQAELDRTRNIAQLRLAEARLDRATGIRR